MAKVSVTLVDDEDGSVSVSVTAEPNLPAEVDYLTPAQMLAVKMMADQDAIHDSIKEATGETT